MKTLLLSLIGSLLLFSFPKPPSVAFKTVVATCYGKFPCNACSSCNYCKNCNSGGTCGICSSKSKTSAPVPTPTHSKADTKSKPQVYVGQCKALTKKGARCKRSGNGSGYCWQHHK